MRIAIVIDGVVSQIVDAPPGFEMHNADCIPCDETVQPLDTWDGHTFTRPQTADPS